MHITSIQIQSYKSYRNSSTLKLTTGFNIITGQNNSGKTALLEALRLDIQSKPHRSITTLPIKGTPPSSHSIITACLHISSQELRQLLFTPGQHFGLVVPAPGTQFNRNDGRPLGVAGPDNLIPLIEWILSQEYIHLTIQTSGGTFVVQAPSVGNYEAFREGTTWKNAIVRVQPDGTYQHSTNNVSEIDNQDFGSHLASLFRHRIYSFSAERFNLGTCPFGPNTVLKPNATNLAEVLSNLHNNPSRFRRYNATIQRILPQVRQVTVKNLSNNALEIFIWANDPDGEREDLAVSLNESGTGVGQVLSMVYVILNSDFPRTILIDEPQSFLHPGAVRKLIEVLKEHPQHQYILTTHSPTVISAANPSTITLVKQVDCASDFQVIDPTEDEQLRQYLLEIGARLSDAFGADGILWVEGATEEICFPMIIEKIAKRPLMGIAIMAVLQTGDLEGRHAKTVFEIYGRLTKGRGLLPPAIGFILDKEGRSEKECEELRHASRNLVSFTPRRLYENYLLNPGAIAAIVNGIPYFRELPVTPAEVQEWILGEVVAWSAGERPKYGALPPKPGEKWKESIHGAHLLKQLFSHFSETRVSYDKVAYSVALTRWLVEHSPEDLGELASIISGVIDGAGK